MLDGFKFHMENTFICLTLLNKLNIYFIQSSSGLSNIKVEPQNLNAFKRDNTQKISFFYHKKEGINLNSLNCCRI